MKITKVIYKDIEQTKAIALCDIVLEDVIKLSGIRLYKNERGYFLIFPSKQDIYQEVELLNEGVNLVFPPSSSLTKKKNWEEFFNPMSSVFYGQILSTILEGYSEIDYREVKEKGCKSYLPKG